MKLTQFSAPGNNSCANCGKPVLLGEKVYAVHEDALRAGVFLCEECGPKKALLPKEGEQTDEVPTNVTPPTPEPAENQPTDEPQSDEAEAPKTGKRGRGK